MVLVLIMEIFVIGILHSFGNANSKRRTGCSCIMMGFITGILYVLVRILEGIGHGNIIHFFYYNNNCNSSSQSNMIYISNGNVIGFCFSFWYMFRNI